MKTLTKTLALTSVFLLMISVVSFAQSWAEYGPDSISYEKTIKIPGQNIGNRHMLSSDEFNKFSKLESNDNNTEIIVKSYSIMAFGKDKGLIMMKRTGSEVDHTIKDILKDEPFLGYRIIFYDVIYDKINMLKPEESKKDLTTVFILEIN
jgi:hypothetical protein